MDLSKQIFLLSLKYVSYHKFSWSLITVQDIKINGFLTLFGSYNFNVLYCYFKRVFNAFWIIMGLATLWSTSCYCYRRKFPKNRGMEYSRFDNKYKRERYVDEIIRNQTNEKPKTKIIGKSNFNFKISTLDGASLNITCTVVVILTLRILTK